MVDQRANRASVLAGIAGGLVVTVIGAILLATGVIHGERKTIVRQAPLGSSAAVAEKSEGGLTVRDIYRKDGPGVAFIQAEITQRTQNLFGFPEQQKGTATGSGFVLDKRGYVATNAPVVNGASRVQVSFGNGEPTAAKIVGKDLSTDLAVIKVDPATVKLKPLTLGDSSKVQVGDPVVAIGNPLGYDDTVTTGIVSALQRQIEAPNNFAINHVIQTDAAINPGNSGGPLIDSNGEVIGVNSQIATSGGSQGSVGIGFAIPINTAKDVLPQLERNGEIKHAYIGVTTAPVSPQIAKALKLRTDKGALVQDVAPGSPAAKAGLRAGRTQTPVGLTTGGDLIVGIDGKTISSPDDIATAIAAKQPGDEITIDFYRGDSKRSVKLTLGDRPDRAANGGEQEPGGGGGGLPFGLP